MKGLSYAIAASTLALACSDGGGAGGGAGGMPGVAAGRVPDGPVVSAAVPPPPLAGGTLFIAADGVTAIVSDPDRDRVVIVDLLDRTVVAELGLRPGDEPGRAAQDGTGRVHVALRRGGAIATIDLETLSVVRRTQVCPAPRGIAFDAATNMLHVACDSGELVSLAPSAETIARSVALGRDLRDVVVDGDRLLVSRFRSAELIVVAADGSTLATLQPPIAKGAAPVSGFEGGLADFAPAVAWRLAPLADGRVAMLHQGALMQPVATEVPSGYGSSGGDISGCGSSIVSTHISPLDARTQLTPAPARRIAAAVTAVDMAVSPHDGRIAIVAAGNNWAPADGQLLILPPVEQEPVPDERLPCQDSQPFPIQGEAVAVAFDGLNRWVVQSREPALLELMDGPNRVVISLGGESRKDTGFALFHMNSGGGIACASCHPEGRDDGRVWSFDPIGPRRTQVPSGGILDTAPFHWSGDMQNFETLVHEVFSGRMGGGRPSDAQLRAFGAWLDQLPAPVHAAPVDGAAVERGRVLFASTEVGCATCHFGPKLTNNESYDVGTGGLFQVPSLVGLAARAPFLHTGCAATLRDRFDPACGGSQHGGTAQLSAAETDDLVAYLESL